jgi:hypothetical protein
MIRLISPAIASVLATIGGATRMPLRLVFAVHVAAAAAYGLVLGSWNFTDDERWRIPLYNAIKLPLLTAATTLLCLPGFFVLNTAAGVRDDFPLALRAILSAQAAFAVALLSLAPVTLLVYVSGVDRDGAILANAAAFTLATAVAQVVLLRRYRPLRASHRVHSWLVWGWLGFFAFSGIQMGWTLRPFVGTPGIEPTFFRATAFTNAYVHVIEIIGRAL